MVVRHLDKSVSVQAPAQLLLIDHYQKTPKAKNERYVFHLELSQRYRAIPWTTFKRKARRLTSLNFSSPRTMPVPDSIDADRLLALWTASGGVSRK